MDIQSISDQRPAWGEEAAVVVPKLDHAQWASGMIATGSGIVAFRQPDAPDQLVVYFEGNLFGAENLKTLHDRALQAYGRMAKSYPTVAKAQMPADAFEVVGTIDPDRFEIDKDHPALQAWTKHDPELMVEKPSFIRMRR